MPSGGGQTDPPAEATGSCTGVASSDMDAAGRCCCRRFALKFSASGPGIGMHPFPTSSSCADAGDTGDAPGTPGGCPNTCASFRVVRIPAARSWGVSALAVENVGSAGSRSDAKWCSGLAFLVCGESLFPDRDR